MSNPRKIPHNKTLVASNMRVVKTIRLIWTFYKYFFLASIIITTCCLGIFFKYGFTTFFALFWFKAGTLGLIYYFINNYKSREYCYYQNLGVSKILLWTFSLTFDFALFIFLIIQTSHLR